MSEIEKYSVEIREDGGVAVVVLIDEENGRRSSLSGEKALAPDIVGTLITDARAKRFEEANDPELIAARKKRVAETIHEANGLFETKEYARQWLTTNNGRLGGRKPLKVAGQDEEGFKRVKEMFAQYREESEKRASRSAFAP